MAQKRKTFAEQKMAGITIPSAPKPGVMESLHRAAKLRAALLEYTKRRFEGLRLYEPLPVQNLFHASKAPERLARGSNRAGKTLCAAVEVARAVTNSDPFGKYPPAGKVLVVGKDGKHLGNVIWDKLFRAGAFDIIRDLDTGEWRAYRPWESLDLERARERKPAPPLIPPRLVRWNEVGWESKRENIPSVVRLFTGWEILFFSSLGKPPQGMTADLGWFDEEIVDPQWYPEVSARLVDRSGRFIWSATPQAGTEQLYDLHERAEKEEMDNVKTRTIQEFVLRLDFNPHISAEQKAALAARLSDADRKVRVEGEFALHGFRVFPEFSLTTHSCKWFQIPYDWTRYASIDPGRQICAVLFLAVPPPDQDDHVYIYDELYLPNCSAEIFGQEMRQKAMGQNFHAFLIDHMGSRSVETGSGRSVEAQYAEALKRNNVSSHATGSGFVWGCTDVRAGVEAVRDWLSVRMDGTPKLRYLDGKARNMVYEIERYWYKRDPQTGMPTDEPVSRGRVHQMANLRYLAMHRPCWVKAKSGAAKLTGAAAAYKRKLERDRAMHGGGRKYINLGPGGQS
jgi:hypothetical protein